MVSFNLKWKTYVNGYSNQLGDGAGISIHTPEGEIIEQAIKFKFTATNNEAKYKTILAELRAAEILELAEFEMISNSKVVLGHIMDESTSQGPNRIT